MEDGEQKPVDAHAFDLYDLYTIHRRGVLR